MTVGNQIPPGAEWNAPIPEVAITGFVAKRVPHRHVGESIYDDLGDLQEIKTVLMRQMLDNIYLVNNSEKAVNERVNLSDFMTSLPGGIKRVEGLDPVQGAFMPIVTPSIVSDILPVIGFIDDVKESRTGITKASAGLDPDALNNVTKGAFMENMNRASQKIEMITRMLAETGVKELVLRVHSLLMRYQDKARIVRMKGKYVPVNPQEWQERTDLTVKVGLGTGNEEERQNKLMLISQLQRDMLAPLGLIEAKQAFALFSDVSKTMGFDMPDKYSLSPDSPEFQQKMANPQPDPAMRLEQAKAQAEAEKVKFQAAQDQQKAQMQAQQKAQEIAMQDQQHQREMQRDMEIERNKQELQARENQMTAQINAQIRERELQHEARLEEMRLANDRQIAELKAATDLQVAQIRAQQAVTLQDMAAQQAASAELSQGFTP